MLFAFPNLADDAVLSNGRYLSTLPHRNVQDDRLDKVARSITTALADSISDFDLGTSRVIRIVSVLAHNLSISATIRIRGGEDPTFAVFNYDSGFLDAYPQIYPPGVLAWGDAGLWDGKAGQGELDGGYPIEFHHLVSPINKGRYWRVEVSDVSNPLGVIDVGKIVISPGYQPSINMIQGITLGYETTSTATETDGQTRFHNARVRRRKVDFSFNDIPGDEGFVKQFDIPRDRGTSEPFLFIYDPADTFHLHRRSIWGTLRRLSPLGVPFATRTTSAYSFVEEL
jgi:hypothetical protein